MFGKASRLFGVCLVLCFAQATFAATFTVTKIADTNDGMCDADCSLREAVSAANATADNDVIEFSLTVFNAPQTITLSLGEIVIISNGTLTINGTGANKLSVSGNSASRIISNNGATTDINRIRFTGGTGVGTASSGRGGALYNNGGTLTLTDLVIINNTAINGGGLNTAGNGTTNIIGCDVSDNTALSSSGGALQNFSGSTTNIYNSSFRSNRMMSTSATGGAIQANGFITITNSTFSGNMATNDGGAISFNGPSLIMTNTTITGNTATDQNGGFHKTTTNNTARLRNNIIAGNTSANNADASGLIDSQGNNLIGNVGTSSGWLASDLLGQMPLLGPLGNYGGMTYTHPLLSGSPAIDAGQNCVIDLSCASSNPPFTVSTDQRGALRPSGSAVDIGAYEVSNTFLAVLPSALINQPYSEMIVPNGTGFTFSVSSGMPPPGISLSGTMPVVVSGTPTQTGGFNFTVTITGTSGSAVVNYRLNAVNTFLGGRVLTGDGFPIANAVVTVTDSMMNTQTARTNAFGFFRFDQVTSGATYSLSVSTFGSRYQFQSRMITLIGGDNSLTITPNPPALSKK